MCLGTTTDQSNWSLLSIIGFDLKSETFISSLESTTNTTAALFPEMNSNFVATAI